MNQVRQHKGLRLELEDDSRRTAPTENNRYGLLNPINSNALYVPDLNGPCLYVPGPVRKTGNNHQRSNTLVVPGTLPGDKVGDKDKTTCTQPLKTGRSNVALSVGTGQVGDLKQSRNSVLESAGPRCVPMTIPAQRNPVKMTRNARRNVVVRGGNIPAIKVKRATVIEIPAPERATIKEVQSPG